MARMNLASTACDPWTRRAAASIRAIMVKGAIITVAAWQLAGCASSSDPGSDGGDARRADTGVLDGALDAAAIDRAGDPGAEAASADTGPGVDGPDAPPDAAVDATRDGALDVTPGTAGDAPPDMGPSSTGGCRLCPLGQRYCNGRCVDPTDPVLGCGKVCFPCTFANATGTCAADGSCHLGACRAGFADCNGSAADGCEADLTDASDCGGCGVKCSGVCTPSGCADSCPPALTTCLRRCLDTTTSTRGCGSCAPCPASSNGEVACVAGACQVTCPSGLTRCTGNDGRPVCADLMNDPAHCGTCDSVCTGDVATSQGVCTAGACSSTCPSGWTRCANGCFHLQSDATHCGTCENACAAGEYCTLGACHPQTELLVADGLGKPEDIAADGQQVFFSTLTDGAIQRVTIGGVPVKLAAGQANPTRLTIDATHVYWTNQLGGAVMRVLRDGSAPAEVVASAVAPRAIALDAGNVYWGENGMFNMTTVVKRAPKGVGVVGQEIAPGAFEASGVVELLVVGGTLYVKGGDMVTEVPLAGGPPVTEPAVAQGFAIDAYHVFRATQAGSVSFEWTSRSGDESGAGRAAIEPSLLVATPCGALFPGGFVPIQPTSLVNRPFGSITAIRFPAVAPGRIAFSAPYAFWTEPGNAPANGRVRMIRVPTP
jgi:hypothetical protein